MRPRAAEDDVEFASLTDADLLARLLGGRAPGRDIVECAETVSRIPQWERRALGAQGLVRRHGVRADRAQRLAALWELAERWRPDDRPTISSPRDATLVLDALRRARKEEVWVLLLDSRHCLVSRETIAVGALNSARMTPRDVFAPAMRAGAAAVILAHNHPSGDPAPSRADRQVTDTLRQATQLIGVPMLDHLIVSARGHHSFRETEAWDTSTAA